MKIFKTTITIAKETVVEVKEIPKYHPSFWFYWTLIKLRKLYRGCWNERSRRGKENR